MKLLRLIPLALLSPLVIGLASSSAEEPVSFSKQVAPILLKHCQACHGAREAEGGVRLDNFEETLKESDSGSPGFLAKNLDESAIYLRIVSDDEDERMPQEADPLPADQISLIRRWIEEGAKFDGPDPKASLASLVPEAVHPDPPEVYPRAIPITALASSGDGQELAVGGYHEITVWNPADGALVRRIKNVAQRTYALAFSGDGKVLAAGSGTPGRLGEVRLFDPATGELTKVLGSMADVVFDIAFSPQGDRLAAAAADSTIHIYDLASGEEILLIEGHSDWVMAVAWSGDGKKLVSGSRDKTAKVFDTSSGELLVTFSGHGNSVKGVAFHPDGEQVYSSGGDNKIQLWKVADGKKTADVGSFGNEVYKLALSGDALFACSADKTVHQYEAKSHKEVRVYSGHTEWAFVATHHPKAKRLATGSFDGEVRLWNTEDGSPLVIFTAAPGYKPLAAAQ